MGGLDGLIRHKNRIKKLKRISVSKVLMLIVAISLIVLTLLPASCSNSETVNDVNEKVSSLLLAQVKLRKEQIANPTSDRLEIMKNMGMRANNLEIQRIFIHLSQEPNTSQIEELEAMGLTLYLDSWIPPVGVHPSGFIIADMPIEKLNKLADKDYVVRLETAERQLEPQSGSQPQSE